MSAASIEARLRELYNELHALRETVMVLRGEIIKAQTRLDALEAAAKAERPSNGHAAQ